MLPLAVISIFVTATALAYAAAIKADERLSVRAARARLGRLRIAVGQARGGPQRALRRAGPGAGRRLRGRAP